MSLSDKFAQWFQGDKEAVAFAEVLWAATQEWDDLEDEGRCDNHNALLSWLAFGKEYTPYFAQNAHLLRPAILQMYLSWTAANTLERGEKLDVQKAYMLRAGIYGVWHLMAWIEGGDNWAVEIGPDIYRTYGETPEELIEEFS